MKIIEKLCEYIEEEINDAAKYIKHALKIRDEYPDAAEMMNLLSAEEMKHMQMLHNQVVKIIENYKKMVGEPPADMLAARSILLPVPNVPEDVVKIFLSKANVISAIFFAEFA